MKTFHSTCSKEDGKLLKNPESFKGVHEKFPSVFENEKCSPAELRAFLSVDQGWDHCHRRELNETNIKMQILKRDLKPVSY